MKISVLGTGNMATGLAVLFARTGHEVTLGGRDFEGHDTGAHVVAFSKAVLSLRNEARLSCCL